MLDDLFSKRLDSMEEYVAGKTVDEIAEKYSLDPDQIISLSSNQNPFSLPNQVKRSIKDSSEDVSSYPSPKDFYSLKKSVSDYIGFSPSNIALGAGIDGVLETLMKVFLEKDDETLIPVPTFSYYKILSKVFDASPAYIERGKRFEIDPEKIKSNVKEDTKLIFLCSPNNPTGNLVQEETLKTALDTGKIVLLDEAYAEFSSRDYVDWVSNYDNLVVLRTFSKAFGLAGLRVGYAVMSEEIVEKYRSISPPFPLTVPSINAAKTSLNNLNHLNEIINKIKTGRDFLTEEIKFKTFKTEANFVLTDVSPHNSEEVCEKLMKQGIILRDCSHMSIKDRNLVRITVGKEKENKKVVTALNQI
ncbi:MAG: Histidinol-phosphate/aromatic aminotransferase [Candidatus Methanohalarchaeum thermophilum]|uniref:Histidinol-phosphate aminotransferase n=1 Tax=Methanohalarchaeum thermophilum TaxID=1903181 RepID=A0A1Q6DTJ5_METT1|nr:MAG: Histidinol-phosphate/aromatic aminotransferase [Candidatus Methanohalarchaeum thermophilum]